MKANNGHDTRRSEDIQLEEQHLQTIELSTLRP